MGARGIARSRPTSVRAFRNTGTDDGKDSCGILTQGLLTGLPGWLAGHERATRKAAARAAC